MKHYTLEKYVLQEQIIIFFTLFSVFFPLLSIISPISPELSRIGDKNVHCDITYGEQSNDRYNKN